jgi:hypothetical protein
MSTNLFSRHVRGAIGWYISHQLRISHVIDEGISNLMRDVPGFLPRLKGALCDVLQLLLLLFLSVLFTLLRKEHGDTDLSNQAIKRHG